MYELTQQATILVLFANAYEMLDEQKRPLSGCSVRYLFWGENGEALYPQSEWDPNKPVGIQTAKVSMDKELRIKMPIAPALYKGSFKQVVGGDGKPVLKLVDVAYMSNVDFSANVIPGMHVPGMVEPAPAPAPEPKKGDK